MVGARQTGFEPRFIELAGNVNAAMPHHVVAKIGEALNAHRKSLNGSHVLVAGIAYKRDIDDIRESPALDVMGVLHQAGARLCIPIRLRAETARLPWPQAGYDLTCTLERGAPGRT